MVLCVSGPAVERLSERTGGERRGCSGTRAGTMEVLVLIDFERSTGDELTVRAGDVVKNVTAATEPGWYEGELRGERGIFPSNFGKEVPVNLMGDSKREPRSIRQTKLLKPQCRKCEVIFSYKPLQEDELELVFGETIEFLKEIEDGWFMGKKNGKIGAFPANFVKEVFVAAKDSKFSEGKSRPKLSDAVFSKEGAQQQRASVRKKTNVKERCQAMFDYTSNAEDELDLKKGEIITLINKVSEDDGWWEGELNGRRGFFPDNFVMLIPGEGLQESKPPQRCGSNKQPVKQVFGMDRSSTEANAKTDVKDEKSEVKDFRSDPPGKIKLPGMFKPPPPPIKDKPPKLPPRPSEDQTPVSPKPTDSKPKESDQFDGVDVSSSKLCHPTANRAKPPQRRPPTGSHVSADSHETETSAEVDGVKKPAVSLTVPDNHHPSAGEAISSSPQPSNTQTEEKPSVEKVLSELKELRMALELFKSQHETDIKELKDELQEERTRRSKLQDELQQLRKPK